MILHTTDRATLLNDKKMKFPEDHDDYGEINNVLSNQAGSQPQKETLPGEEAEFEEEEDVEDDEEEYEDEDVEKVPVSVGKIGRALGEAKKIEENMPEEKGTTEKPKIEQPEKRPTEQPKIVQPEKQPTGQSKLVQPESKFRYLASI
jgi:hypothetical protein